MIGEINTVRVHLSSTTSARLFCDYVRWRSFSLRSRPNDQRKRRYPQNQIMT